MVPSKRSCSSDEAHCARLSMISGAAVDTSPTSTFVSASAVPPTSSATLCTDALSSLFLFLSILGEASLSSPLVDDPACSLIATLSECFCVAGGSAYGASSASIPVTDDTAAVDGVELSLSVIAITGEGLLDLGSCGATDVASLLPKSPDEEAMVSSSFSPSPLSFSLTPTVSRDIFVKREVVVAGTQSICHLIVGVFYAMRSLLVATGRAIKAPLLFSGIYSL